ncbi:class I SAM-dependent methyltransferase [Aquibacillus kalidii]|uniref:class I SAM-dependent methyltransferase n=1 Tax=Aquibacillus kalidii TaxID=2762597 RepID=UPI001647E46C|nr:class I SAM-dependent methyltransferase [Aquibacillus kalidii]
MNLLKKLIGQAKNPSGRLGSFMLKIMNVAHSNMNKWAFEYIVVKDNAMILDIGCGGGKTIQLLSQLRKDGKIYGIDYSQQAVTDSIRANHHDVETGKVDIRRASVANLPFQRDAFDIITAFQTHYFWDDIEKGLKEIFRVLKSEGCFLIVAETYKMNYHMHSYKTKEEMEILLREIGFKRVKIFENKNKKFICIQAIKG